MIENLRKLYEIQNQTGWNEKKENLMVFDILKTKKIFKDEFKMKLQSQIQQKKMELTSLKEFAD